jgi:hypothetical protein
MEDTELTVKNDASVRRTVAHAISNSENVFVRKDIPVQNVIDPVKKVFMDMAANKLVLDIHQVTTPVILLLDNGSVSLATLVSTVRILASKAHLGVDVWVNVHARIMQSAIM